MNDQWNAGNQESDARSTAPHMTQSVRGTTAPPSAANHGEVARESLFAGNNSAGESSGVGKSSSGVTSKSAAANNKASVENNGTVGQVDSTSTASTVPNSLRTTNRDTPSSLIGKFLGLVRFSHTIFALPFAALACVFAFVTPGVELSTTQTLARLIGVLLCMVFARSAAMAFNRLADAKIDGENPRTAGRHLPSGQLSRTQVATFFVVNCFAFIASCGLFLPNWIPLAASLPVLAWICGYSLAKRFTSAAHLWLGVALALSPICAWLGIRGEVVLTQPLDIVPACVLAAAIALWVAGFDIIYACQDAEFDRQAGLRSIPSRFGLVGALRISAALHLAMLLVLVVLPLSSEAISLGVLYGIALALVAILIIRQHSIVSPKNLNRVGEAFFTLNAIISLGFSSFAALDALWR